MRRSGTRYVAEAKSSSVEGRLKRFQFSTEQAYLLEFGASIMRFYRHQAQIAVADTDGAVSNGTFTSNITGWDDRSTGGAGNQISHDSTNGRLTLETSGTATDDIGWAEQDITIGAGFVNVEHVLKFRVIGAPGDKIEFQVGSASLGSQILSAVEKEVGYHCVAFTPTATTFYIQFRNRGSFRDKDVQIDNVSLIDNAGVEIDTPWPESVLPNVRGTQSADVLYLFHGNYQTHKLTRLGHTTWSLIEVAWQDGPYLDENDTTTTLLPSAATGLGITLTLSSIAGVNGGLGWQAQDVGRLVRYKKTTNWGYAVIVSITSTLIAVADVRRDFEATPTATTTWRLGKWKQPIGKLSSADGFPQVGSFFEQRLYCAATNGFPQTFWATQTADFENMQPDDGAGTVAADDALEFTLSADDINEIRWMSAGEDTLVIGTNSGEWVPTSTGEVITPLDITVRRQTKHGSAQIEPVRIGNTVLFVQRAERKIREFGRAIEVDGFRAPDMARLAEHITFGGISQIDYAEERESIVWAVRNDGKLLSMTYRREEDVVGWARHVIGGEYREDVTFKQVWQVDDSAGTFVDETADANDSGSADWTLFPATEAVGDYAAFGYTEEFSQIKFDYSGGTAGVAGAVTWEYWDGSAWTALSGITDNTTGFTVAVTDGLTVSWTMPTDWAKRILNTGKKLYYVRARITTVYTTNPILDQGYIQKIGDVVVESVAVIPGDNGSGQTQDSTDHDEVWLLVKRTINGSTKRYIEFFERDFETGHDQEDAYYLDSVITYDGVSATTITGLSHLEGETVGVLADGAIQDDKTVASAQITLDDAAYVVQVGLRYKHKLKTLKISAGNPAGTPVGKTKRIEGLTFVVLNSHTLKFGPDATKLQTRDFRVVSDPMDLAAPLFTGEKFVEFEGDWGADPRIVIESDDPVPFTLLAIAPEITVNPLK